MFIALPDGYFEIHEQQGCWSAYKCHFFSLTDYRKSSFCAQGRDKNQRLINEQRLQMGKKNGLLIVGQFRSSQSLGDL